MSIYVSDPSHSLNTANSSKCKKRAGNYEGFHIAAFIISTAAGLTAFIHAYIDVDSIASFFIRDEAVAGEVVRFVIPIFSIFAGAALCYYSKRGRK